MQQTNKLQEQFSKNLANYVATTVLPALRKNKIQALLRFLEWTFRSLKAFPKTTIEDNSAGQQLDTLETILKKYADLIKLDLADLIMLDQIHKLGVGTQENDYNLSAFTTACNHAIFHQLAQDLGLKGLLNARPLDLLRLREYAQKLLSVLNEPFQCLKQLQKFSAYLSRHCSNKNQLEDVIKLMRFWVPNLVLSERVSLFCKNLNGFVNEKPSHFELLLDCLSAPIQAQSLSNAEIVASSSMEESEFETISLDDPIRTFVSETTSNPTAAITSVDCLSSIDKSQEQSISISAQPPSADVQSEISISTPSTIDLPLPAGAPQKPEISVENTSTPKNAQAQPSVFTTDAKTVSTTAASAAKPSTPNLRQRLLNFFKHLRTEKKSQIREAGSANKSTLHQKPSFEQKNSESHPTIDTSSTHQSGYGFFKKASSGKSSEKFSLVRLLRREWRTRQTDYPVGKVPVTLRKKFQSR